MYKVAFKLIKNALMSQYNKNKEQKNAKYMYSISSYSIILNFQQQEKETRDRKEEQQEQAATGQQQQQNKSGGRKIFQ